MELGKGTVVDRYTIDVKLGQGGMATVYKARHNQLGTWHAIKVLSSQSLHVRQRLLHEGQVQARMRHPNIVAVSDVIDVRGQPGLVMEYVDGISLDQFLERVRLTPEQVDELARGILAAVAEAHRHGLVHRDLKPGNVLVQPRPGGLIPKVTDFGLVKDTASDPPSRTARTRTDMIMGTACYMAPEQIKSSKKVDQRADVFALGAIFYEMLCGQRAFPQDEVFDTWKAIDAGTYRPLDELVPDLPERMLATIARALTVDRDQRFPDVPSMTDAWCGREPGQSAQAVVPSGPWDQFALEKLVSRPPVESEDADPLPAGTWEAPYERDEHGPTTSEPTFYPDPASEPASAPRPIGTSSSLTAGRALAVGLGGMGLLGGLAVMAALLLVGVALTGMFGAETAAQPVAAAPAPVLPEPTPPAPAPEPVVEPPAEAVVQPEVEPVVSTPAAPDPAPVVAPAPSQPRPKAQVPKPPPSVATGKLQLRSTPWSRIELDGAEADETGRWVRDLPAGTHRVRLTTEDGRSKDTSVQVVAGTTVVFCWNFDLERVCN